MTRRRALAVGMTVALLGLSGAGSSWAHSGESAHEDLSERELRKAETSLLGAGHAAEHAQVRRFERRSRARWRRLSEAQRRSILERRQRSRRVLARAAAAGVPADEGRWNGTVSLPVIGVHATLLPTGKIMWFSRLRSDDKSAYLWDPAKPASDPAALRRVDPPVDLDTGRPVELFCAGQSLLADGQLLVTGGNLADPTTTTDWKGLNRIYTFDPWSEQWTEQPRMAHGRWYPTQTLLPDGRTMIVSGRDETGIRPGSGINKDIELFSPPATRGGQGTIAKLGAHGPALVGSPNTPSYYPHWIVMPNGNILNAGPKPEESFVLQAVGGALTSAARPDWAREHYYGTGVLLPGGPAGSSRVAQIGGFGKPGLAGAGSEYESAALTETFDEAQPATAPVAGPALAQARSHHNTVLLPDGSMVSVGGGYGNRDNNLRLAGPEHRPIDIWDPATNTWKLGPAQVYKRAYHSTALLLPDGRVVSAGDDGDPVKEPAQRTDIAELYEPAYLFAPGPRPEITAAPANVGWNQPFTVKSSSPIARAVLMAPGATTHANDMQQRHVELRITPNGAGADLVAPPSANVAPPGWYMLFALSSTGKPSVAKWILVGGSASAPPPTTSTPTTSTPNDTTAPQLSLKISSRKLQRVLKKGLKLVLTTNEGGRARITLSVKRATGRRLGLKRPARGPVRIGSLKRTLPSGKWTLRVKLSPEARRAIKQVRTVKLLVRASMEDAAGNSSLQAQKVKLRR